ncbi:ankyrin [Coniochaeta ligniaria NRRL 30616]|uniref:Ankyrin n=1 Tax=Coniochaeta ligniaria NRRL 30616 TaxID=1408157 RepID=A0A1J7J6U5_9PEZI|nr:ankyrin [Coniochaeta ligniaria NRRL 30616]
MTRLVNPPPAPASCGPPRIHPDPRYPARPPLPRRLPEEVIEQLRDAASTNDLSAIDKLLDTHRTINTLGLDRVMTKALERDYAAVVERLLGYGMSMDYTFALEAVGFKAKESLDLFLRRGFDFNEPISFNEPTVFAYAVHEPEMALWLLEHAGADLNKATGLDVTPMSFAAEDASPELLRKLLKRGGDVRRGEVLQHALDRRGAAADDIVEVLGLLIDHDAPLNAIMYENHQPSTNMFFFMPLGTPLHKAAEMGKADAVISFNHRGINVVQRLRTVLIGTIPLKAQEDILLQSYRVAAIQLHGFLGPL